MSNLKSNMGLDQPGAGGIGSYSGGTYQQELKKPQEYDYLDYKENENRLQQLQQELDLNRFKNLFDENGGQI